MDFSEELFRFKRSELTDLDSNFDTVDGVVSTTFKAGLLQSFTMAFSEIGDKTFFIACIMAMRYNRIYTFLGSWLALCAMTGIGCGLGKVMEQQEWIKQETIHYIAGGLFALFGAQMFYEAYKNWNVSAMDDLEEVAEEMRGDDQELKVRFRKNSKSEDAENAEIVVEILNHETEATRLRVESSQESLTESVSIKKEEATSIKSKIEGFFLLFFNKVFLKTFALTFIGEWGDKSQLATISLAVTYPPLSVFIGTCIGYIICIGLAVLSGHFIVSKIRLTYVNIAGGILFWAFAGYTFYLAANSEND